MCGIVGYTGPREAYPIIIKGLKRLEYRGYDSAGVALINQGQVLRERRVGKVAPGDRVGRAGRDDETGDGSRQGRLIQLVRRHADLIPPMQRWALTWPFMPFFLALPGASL